MTVFRTALAAALVLAGQPAAHAQANPSYSVFGEDDDDNITRCAISHRSSIRTIDRLLRTNGATTVPYSDKTLSRDVILAYVSLSALPIRQGGAETGRCAISVTVEIYSNGNFTNPVNGASHFGKMIYCNNGSLLIHSATGAQDAVNEELAGIIPGCLTEYEASKN